LLAVAVERALAGTDILTQLLVNLPEDLTHLVEQVAVTVVTASLMVEAAVSMGTAAAGQDLAHHS
jgi:hypothetical protein